jgi:hypothetical protein
MLLRLINSLCTVKCERDFDSCCVETEINKEILRYITDDWFIYSTQEENPTILSSQIVAMDEWNKNEARIKLHMKPSNRVQCILCKYVNVTFINGSSDMDIFLLPTDLSARGLLNCSIRNYYRHVVCVTIDGDWDNWVYWPLTSRNYK